MRIVPTKINAGRREKEHRGRSRRSSTKSRDGFLSAKPCSKPKYVVRSSQIAIADGTEDSEEESKGNVENFVPLLSSNSTDNKNKATKCLKKTNSRVRCTAALSKKRKHCFVFPCLLGRLIL